MFKRLSLIALLAASVLSGCAVVGRPEVAVVDTTPVRPNQPAVDPLVHQAATGSIYNARMATPLFEDRRARRVGDIITVQINERSTASQSANSSVDKTSDLNAGISALPFIAGNSFGRAGARASSENSFEGKGATDSSGLITGSITVTVVEVLPNGNLLVAGEKQIGVNHNVERMRLSGVVNPVNIQPGNTVSSTTIADARIELRGMGQQDQAQAMGWLSRVFLSVWPL
jgi:flagellar L-ring protein precursor FlgH